MKAYRITHWNQAKEVTKSGNAASADTPLDQLKVGSLSYIRQPVFGHALPPDWLRLVRESYKKGAGFELMIWGFYWLIHNLAADQPRAFRGWILDDRQQPIGAEGIKEQFLLNDLDVVQQCLTILTDPQFMLLEYVEFEPQKETPESGPEPTLTGEHVKPRETTCPVSARDTGEHVPLFLNENETKKNKNLNENETKGVLENACPDSISQFFFSGSDSDFDSASPQKLHLRAEVFLFGLLRPSSDLDRNTLRKLLGMVFEAVRAGRVEKTVYRRMAAAARAARADGIRCPIAKFVAEMRTLGFRLKPRPGAVETSLRSAGF